MLQAIGAASSRYIIVPMHLSGIRAEYQPMKEEHGSLIGLASLARMAFTGQELASVRQRLEARLEHDPRDTNAWMDLSTLMQLGFDRDAGLAMQAEALKLQRLYHLPAKGKANIRLLVLKAPGELMDNAPIEFLLEGSDVAIDQFYLSTELTELPPLSEHDLLYVAIGQSARNNPLLQRLQDWLQDWSRPVLNAPARIAATTRDGTHALLHGAPNLIIPAIGRVDRPLLEKIGNEAITLASVFANMPFPVTVRPVDSQAGQGLARIDSPADIPPYLAKNPAGEFYLTRFVDYSGPDSLFRKYRIVLIDGKPFAGHMAISYHWIIHYLNAGMYENADKRREEAEFMDRFDDFASRHMDALRAIAERIGLDYLVIDCAETRDGDLLVFEVDPGAIIHDMDPPELFPYKQEPMHRLFDAFHAMLCQRMRETDVISGI